MPSDRCRFIKSLGLTLASLVVAGQLPACAAPSPDEDEPSLQAPEWDELRQCWLSLGELHAAVQTGNWGQDIEARLDEQKATHLTVLNALTASGEIEEAVVSPMQLAFEEALFHVGRSTLSCYIMTPFEYEVRLDLIQQADMLQEVAADLDPATVAQAQAAIARDVAFFQAVTAEGGDRQRLEEQYAAGQLDASPEALGAARILVALLLEPAE